MNASVASVVGIQSSGLSLRRNFVWMLAGNILYALCQWGMIIVLAKFGSPFMVGQFALGLAISTPVLMLANLQLRVVQATDVRRGYQFGEYLGLRMVTTIIAFTAIAVIASIAAHEPKTALVVIAVGFAKSIEAMSDVFYGLFQLNDHLDQIGTSMMLRGAGSVSALTAGLYLTHDVLWGVVGAALAWLTVLILFDTRRGRRFLPEPASGASWIERWRVLRPHFNFNRQWALTRIALPLGIVMTLASLNMNVPRYFVESAMGETKLGVFSTMAYAMSAMATVVDSMTHSSTPKLARLFASGKWKGFRSLLFRFALLGLGLGVVATICTKLAGAQVLTILYGRTYAEYSNVFVWLTAAAAISAVAMLLTNGLVSARRFRLQVPMFAAVVATNALACALLVPRFGLMGAARAPLIASTAHLVIAAVLVTHVLASAKMDGSAVPENQFADSWEAGGL